MSLRALITEPELLGLDMEDPKRIALHRQILFRKPMLRGVFEEFYRLSMDLDRRYLDGAGARVELGAGVTLFKVCYPDVIVTDIKPAEHLDAVVDGQAMPFAEGSVRALYGLSFFHHLPDPEAFLRECRRVLRPGGGCILLDPYHGPIASRFWKHLHATETFDKSAPGWRSADRAGLSMLDANQALSYIVFTRDRARFDRLFPELEIVYQKPVPNYFRYLFSGGLNYRSLLPPAFIGPLKVLEKLLSPMLSVTGLYHMIVLRRRGPICSRPPSDG